MPRDDDFLSVSNGGFEAVADTRDRLDDLDPLLDLIGAQIETNVQLRFDTKTDPDGKQWVPWSEYTAALRRAEGRGNLLEYTGFMRDTLSHHTEGDTAVVSLSPEYAADHEYGRGVPRRAMLNAQGGGLGATDLDDVLELIDNYFSQ